MYRLCLLVIFLAGPVLGATVTSSVFCDNVMAVFSCEGPPGVSAGVQFSIGIPSTITGTATSIPGGPFPGHGGAASASLQGDVLITVTSGPAAGFFFPCYDLFAMGSSIEGPSNALIRFGSHFSFNNGGPTCTTGPPSMGVIPFTLGVPQVVPFTLTVNAQTTTSQAIATATLTGTLLVFDANQNLVPDATYAVELVPEPVTGTFVFCGGVLFLVARRRERGLKLAMPSDLTSM